MKEKRNIFSFSSINIRSDNNINNKILDLKFPKIKLIDNNNFNSISEFKDYNKTRKSLIKTDSNFFLSRNRMKILLLFYISLDNLVLIFIYHI